MPKIELSTVVSVAVGLAVFGGLVYAVRTVAAKMPEGAAKEAVTKATEVATAAAK